MVGTPEPATKIGAEPTATEPAVAQLEIATQAADTAAPAPTVQPAPAPLDWLRTAQIGLAILAVGLGLATLWVRARQ